MKSFARMLFSNKEVVHARKFKLIVIVLLFLINVSLISVPNFMGKMESINSINHLELIEEAFTEIYENELDCLVENSEMNCNIAEGLNYQGYDVLYTDVFDLDDITESVIYFSKTQVAIIFIDEDDLAYQLVGDYSLLEGQDFSTVLTEDTDGLTREEYFLQATDNILSGIYYSTLDEHMSLIYIGQFMQSIIYVFVVSSMFMLMNFKAKVKKLTYLNSYKIVITSMTGPALLVAIVALFSPGFASLLFFILYAIRAMLIYYRMNFSDQTYID